MINFKIPSKTFLCGEYAALKGGPSLVLMTEPNFVGQFKRNERKEQKPLILHPDSPGGMWWNQHQDFLQDWSYSFLDPHNGEGGMGASTAQFLSIYLFVQSQKGLSSELSSLLKDYHSVSWNGEGLAPSGADLIAQFFVTSNEKSSSDLWDLVFVDNRDQIPKCLCSSWSFTDVDYIIVRTGRKLATHEHLRSLILGDVSDLSAVVEQVQAGVENQDSSSFINGIAEYGDLLKRRGLVAPATTELLSFISSEPGVLAAKGCGAMGADMIFICVEKNKKETLCQSFFSEGLFVVNQGSEL